ncbi:MAG: hypothetical protein WBN79_00715, partial [Gemmatimonadota bacterium]
MTARKKTTTKKTPATTARKKAASKSKRRVAASAKVENSQVIGLLGKVLGAAEGVEIEQLQGLVDSLKEAQSQQPVTKKASAPKKTAAKPAK